MKEDKFRSTLERLKHNFYKLLDRLYVPLDRKFILRTKNIRLIPTEHDRKGGKYSYAEWAHVIGIFQTLIYLHLPNKEDNNILDVGCGTGLLGIACEPFLGKKGRLVGIDVSKNDIDFCRSYYPANTFEFIHLDINNPFYSPSQGSEKIGWPLEDASFDMVTALSVWTHLREEDALRYMKEVYRVLKPGGKAIITFFLLDHLYQNSVNTRSAKVGSYHLTPQLEWIFDQPAYGSSEWLTPKWAKVPEYAIGITTEGFKHLASTAKLDLIEQYPGNWKEVPGVFFQDVTVFGKS